MAQTITEVYRLLRPFIQRQINEAAGSGRGLRPDVGHTHTDAFYTEAEVDALLASYVEVAGDTMTGALTLFGAPTADLHAATKAYADLLANVYVRKMISFRG